MGVYIYLHVCRVSLHGMYVCMSGYTYVHVCAPKLHVWVYIFISMVAEFACVRVYVYIYHTEFAGGICVYIYAN